MQAGGIPPHHKFNNMDFAEVTTNENGIKVWKCRLCGQKISHRNNFQKHLMIHSGDKPFICPHCFYRTSRKGNLKRHIQIRHLISEDNIIS